MCWSIYLLDSNFEGIQDFKSELQNFACVTCYNHICTILVKLDSAVAKVPTDENVSSAIMH